MDADYALIKLIAAGSLIVAGILVLMYGNRLRREASEVAFWPETTARILSNGIKKERNGRWSTVFRYEYVVAEKHYENDAVDYEAEFTDQALAEMRAKRNAEGSEVVIRYDAAQPERSVVKPSKYTVWIMIGFGVFFIIAGPVAFVLI